MALNKSVKSTVAIIGGGISGIKAAIDLGKAGINVVILEAKNRLGGRISNTTVNGITYDLGPSWLHDTAHNELMPFIEKAGLKYVLHSDEPQLYGYKGCFDQEKVDWAAARFYSAVQEQFGPDLATFSSSCPSDLSLKEYVEQYLATSSRDLSEFEREVVPQIARMKELWHAVGWDRISCRYLNYADSTSADAFLLDSFVKLLQPILEILEQTPNVATYINTEVSKVISNTSGLNSGEICSNYCIETCCGKKFNVDYVIVTIPVMVLKEIHEDLFEPPLPGPIARAVELTDSAQLGKVYIRFSSSFWDTTKVAFNVCGNGNTDGGPGSHIVCFVNLYPSTQQPLLLAITSPPLTTVLEEEGKDALHYLEFHFKSIQLEQAQPLPEVIDVITTHWIQDRYIRGSYSALPVDVHPADIVDPFVSGDGNLRFAGEHTVKAASGCAHGAYRSGEREASFIIKQELFSDDTGFKASMNS